MAAKLLHLHSLSEDNPELQKQIGCMTGIFQMFDRHQMIVSGRRITDQSHSQRRTLPRQSQYSNGSLEEDFIGAYQRQPAEMISNKIASERQRFSTESSRASFSSSRSSSFSSVDYCRSHQPDPAYNDRITFPEAAFEDSRCSMSPRLARQSADFRDIVKDSMLKEARGLSNNTNREENMTRAAKQRDALRDSYTPKTVAGVATNGSQNVRDGMKDSIKGLSNLHGAKYDEPKEQRMQSDYGYKSKEASRISYDGMETSRFSFESRESLSASKFRDLPRLSLDDRECLMRQADCDSLSNSQLKASLKRSCSTNEKGHNLREVLGTQQQRRPPSLVAKLMGLTALPDSGSRNDKSLKKNCSEQDELDAFRSSSFKKQTPPVPTPPSSKNEPASPRWMTPEMKPILSSRIHVEPAPWKVDGGVSLLKQSARHVKSPSRQPNPFPSVYGEIEKRFKDIEFDKSGKDLRALKQILESIRAKGLLEPEKQEQAPNAVTSRKHVSPLIKSNLRKVSAGQNNARGKHTTEVAPTHNNYSRRLDSPIVIMKPISRPPRSETTKKMNKDEAVCSDEKFKYVQHSARSHEQSKDSTASSPRNLGSVSPRTRLKRLELEKQIQGQSHSSVANKNRLPTAKLTESNSPGGKLSLKSSTLQQNGSQIHEILLDIKKLRSRENEAALASDGYSILDSKQNREATRSVRSSKLNGSRSPSKRASRPAVQASDHLSDSPSSPIQLDEVAPEHPSPVSVLNNSAYLDDQKTEEKQQMKPLGDVDESYSAYKSSLSSEIAFSSEISRKKLISIDSLVQKLKRLNSTHDESKTDYIALLTDDTSPDNRYISEILLASGLLLREFGSNAKNAVQFHPSGNLINPELFNVLEQTKSYNHQLNEDTTNVAKTHRKLIFDTLNEILTKKLASNANVADCSIKWQNLARKALNTQNLIKELCTEIEELQPRKEDKCSRVEEDEKESGGGGVVVSDMLREDVMQTRFDGMKFESGIGEVVLDIERLIFKDMVDEIVMGDDGVACRNKSRPKSRSGGFRILK